MLRQETYRRKQLAVPLFSHEREVIRRLAEMQGVGMATLARQLLLREAAKMGLVLPAAEQEVDDGEHHKD